jgi:parallel beta-helix repeat protein
MDRGLRCRVLRVLCVGCALFCLWRPSPASAQSADIYPWQNIQQVVQNYPAGTTFYLKAGVHRMQSITPRTGDRFIGEAGTVLSGARQLTTFTRSGSYWVATGQTQQGAVRQTYCRSGFPRCSYPEDFFIDGVPLRHADNLSAVGPGTFFFDYGADRIYFWDDPTNRYVEASVTGHAFQGYATDVLLSGLVVEKYATPADEAAVAVGTRWTLQYSEVKLNHSAGVRTGMSSVVRNTSTHHNGQYGFIGAGNNAVIEANEISYNNFAGFDPYWAAGGSKWVLTSGLTVRSNFSHHNGGPGLWTDIGNIYTLYENNTVEDNERAGIFHEVSYDAIIRNNTARRNGTTKPYPYWTTGAGIEVVNSLNVEVYGNVLEDNWQGITGLDDHRSHTNTLKNLNVHDNWITSRPSNPGGGRSGIIDMDGWTAYAAGNNRFHGNHYVLGNPNGQHFMWFGERTQYEWRAYGNDVGGSFGAAASQNVRYLSDQGWAWMINGWGPAERNQSNGEYSAGDGRPISLDGVTYAKGIGVHSTCPRVSFPESRPNLRCKPVESHVLIPI